MSTGKMLYERALRAGLSPSYRALGLTPREALGVVRLLLTEDRLRARRTSCIPAAFLVNADPTLLACLDRYPRGPVGKAE